LGGTYGLGSKTLKPAINESLVVNPGEMMAIGDGFLGDHFVLSDGNDWLWRIGMSTNANTDATSARVFARHQGKANIAFCDGHVESPTLKFLFEDTSNVALSRWNRDHLPHREKLP
jgi:prepilin-type processing-associated H-X9-DG protein